MTSETRESSSRYDRINYDFQRDHLWKLLQCFLIQIMTTHRVYRAIVKAIKEGRLKEPFSKEDFRGACPGFAEGTYNVFLNKHRRGNPGGNSELFDVVQKEPRKLFKVIRPFKYDLDC